MAADNSNRGKPTRREVDWKALVAEIEDLKAPHPAYQFTRKTFHETDEDGIYNDRPN